MSDDIKIHPEVSKYMAGLARKGHKITQEKYGKDFYSQIAKKSWENRKNNPRINYKSTSLKVLGEKYGISRQRVHQIIKMHGSDLAEKEKFSSEWEWQQAVVDEFFKAKRSS